MIKNDTKTSESIESYDSNILSSNVSEVFNFFVFCYMFIILLMSNIATWTIRGYKRSLPYLRTNIILILNSFLVETFNVFVSITVLFSLIYFQHFKLKFTEGYIYVNNRILNIISLFFVFVKKTVYF